MILKEAFYIAREGRPGPVLIDICKDVQNATGEFRYDMTVDLPGFEPWPTVDMSKIRQAAVLINQAERPLILAGHGIKLAGVSRELLEMVERAEIPVVTTLLGAGDIPETHPLSLGMGGMHGEAYANRAVQGCDVLIAMGMRFDDRITGSLDRFAKQAKIIHFELDKAEVGKNVVPDLPVIGNLGETLPALLSLIEQRKHPDWLAELNVWREDSGQTDIINYEVDELIPPYVIRQLWHSTKDTERGPAIIVTDVGQHQMWESQYFVHEFSGQLLTSGGRGRRLRAACSHRRRWPTRTDWCGPVGDGGQMTLQELAVLKQEAICPNRHHQQRVLGHGASGSSCSMRGATSARPLSLDFVKLATPTASSRCKPEDVRRLKQALETPGRFDRFPRGRAERLFDGSLRAAVDR